MDKLTCDKCNNNYISFGYTHYRYCIKCADVDSIRDIIKVFSVGIALLIGLISVGLIVYATLGNITFVYLGVLLLTAALAKYFLDMSCCA